MALKQVFTPHKGFSHCFVFDYQRTTAAGYAQHVQVNARCTERVLSHCSSASGLSNWWA